MRAQLAVSTSLPAAPQCPAVTKPPWTANPIEQAEPDDAPGSRVM
nr:hypothetical protein [Cellulosimicrobium sp. MM]